MHRVIFLTFGFLGWAWYELSGGSSFVPGDNKLALIAPPSQIEASQPERVARISTKSVSALPSSVIIRKAEPEPEPEVTMTTGLGTSSLTDVTALTAGLDNIMDEPESGADPVKLIVTALQAEPQPQPTVLSASSIDYRTVTGSTVNLRSGPGTSYGVVTRLYEGEEVEVMQDDGSGWVQLRAMAGNNEIGWMSGNFLTASN